jgi:ankyrin repeat protein
MVEYLLIKGAKMLGRNKDGATYLMGAAMSGNLKLFQKLIDLGQKINEEDAKGRTVVNYAKLKKRKEILQFLASKGMNIN